MTPHEAWMMKLIVSHVQVFGYDAYVYISKNERRKLDPKAKTFVFVGYGEETAGCCFCNLVRANIIIQQEKSREVGCRRTLLEVKCRGHTL